MKRVLVVAAMGVLLSIGAEAADPRGVYTIYGAGNDTCKDWLVDRDEDSVKAWQREQWVMGYVTAYNRFKFDGKDVASGTDMMAVFDWVDDWCRERPEEMLEHAAFAFFEARQAEAEE